MGIKNIHILINDPVDFSQARRNALALHQDRRIAEHRRGQHPDGSKRRDCPLCVAGK
jgi:hypothetical protein